MNNIQTIITNFFVQYGFQLVGALIILAVGFLVSSWVGSALQRWLEGRQLEPPGRKLIVRVARLLVLLLTLVIALDKCGVPITTIVAGIHVSGLGGCLLIESVPHNLRARSSGYYS